MTEVHWKRKRHEILQGEKTGLDLDRFKVQAAGKGRKENLLRFRKCESKQQQKSRGKKLSEN